MSADNPRLPCQADPKLWVSNHADARHEAMRKCRDCPIVAACLTGAIERREMAHVWGGKDFSHATTRPKLPPAPPLPIAHGTIGGYRTHQRRNVPICEPCRQAERIRREARGRVA